MAVARYGNDVAMGRRILELHRLGYVKLGKFGAFRADRQRLANALCSSAIAQSKNQKAKRLSKVVELDCLPE